jgi:mitogen-activated protein kinase kinase
MPSLRSVSDSRNIHLNSTALGVLGKARNPAVGSSSFAGRPGGGGALDGDAMKRAQALLRDRMKMGTSSAASSPGSPAMAPVGGNPNGFAGGMRSSNMPPIRPGANLHHNSAPNMPTGSLSERRANKFGAGGGLKLSDMASPPPGRSPGGLKRAGAPKLTDMSSGDSTPADTPSSQGTKLDDFKKYIDAEKGWITFDGAATITRTGVNFSNGQTFAISLDEMQIVGELGKGNYGTVYKVKHAKPSAPRFGHGLSGVKLSQIEKNQAEVAESESSGKIMAMKEIRLELDDAKFTTILKELVILHECVSPYIIDFYGAFYQEGAVYMCIEYMDGGSVDKLYGGGMPENILRKVTHATILGLKCLKDDHSIIHRDVKPTNVLINTRGEIKICDFGVSGNLVASIAKTNIGCQSYMAPERISGGGMAQSGASDGTYSVQSDVWSLGLTIIECALGRYPYPPEVSSTIFGQLNVRIHPVFTLVLRNSN